MCNHAHSHLCTGGFVQARAFERKTSASRREHQPERGGGSGRVSGPPCCPCERTAEASDTNTGHGSRQLGRSTMVLRRSTRQYCQQMAGFDVQKGGGLVGTARPGEQLATYIRRGDGNVRLRQSGISRIDFCSEFDRQSQASAISQR